MEGDYFTFCSQALHSHGFLPFLTIPPPSSPSSQPLSFLQAHFIFWAARQAGQSAQHLVSTGPFLLLDLLHFPFWSFSGQTPCSAASGAEGLALLHLTGEGPHLLSGRPPHAHLVLSSKAPDAFISVERCQQAAGIKGLCLPC